MIIPVFFTTIFCSLLLRGIRIRSLAKITLKLKPIQRGSNYIHEEIEEIEEILNLLDKIFVGIQVLIKLKK